MSNGGPPEENIGATQGWAGGPPEAPGPRTRTDAAIRKSGQNRPAPAGLDPEAAQRDAEGVARGSGGSKHDR
jgi:hypothetical protein